MADCDAIVIGAGHNGLVAALYLARAGWRVEVLERADAVGGALRTEEVTLPGFKHDLYATNLSVFAASPAYRDFRAQFDALNLRFVASPFPYASVYAGHKAARVYADRERTEREIAAHSAADVAGWRRTLALFERTAPDFLALFFTALPSIDAARHAWRLATRRPGDALRLWRILRESSRGFVDRTFGSPEVKGLFAPWTYHMDHGPDMRGGATFAFVAAMSGHLRGLLAAEGGAGRLAQALRALIERHGGKVRTGAEVRRVRTERGTAVGVELAGGEVLGATRAIIANVAPPFLFGRLVGEDDLPARFMRHVRRYRYGPGTFVVHMALDRKLEWRAAADLSEFSYVHVCGRIDDLARTHAQCSDGLLPDRPMLVVSQTTSVDPSRAPSSRHVVRAHVRAVPAAIRGDAAGTIAARDWPAAKEAFAERVLDLAGEHAPNLRQALLARHVVSPLELEQANPNLIGGDCTGGSHRLEQNYFRRPIPGWSRYATPIRRLYMIGASTWPGGGVHGASGYLVARRLLED